MSIKKILKNPLILALDVDSDSEALRWVEDVGALVGAIKIGPRLGLRYGAPLISRIAQTASVFVDHKFLDIPSTMEAAIIASFDAGASLATVHCWSGPEALARLSSVEEQLNRIRPFCILGVTVLTSFTRATLPPPQSSFSIKDQVIDLSDMASQSGLRALVCSPEETESIRQRHPTLEIITPGIRLSGGSSHDQKRTATPRDAIKWGAQAIVVGRPILEARDPRVMIGELLHEMVEA